MAGLLLANWPGRRTEETNTWVQNPRALMHDLSSRDPSVYGVRQSLATCFETATDAVQQAVAGLTRPACSNPVSAARLFLFLITCFVLNNCY